MPARGTQMAPAERWDLVNFLRSLQEPAPQESQASEASTTLLAQQANEGSKEGGNQEPAKEPAKEQAKGDPAKGKEFFDANCTICHIADSDQALIGPGLKNLFHWPPHKLSDGTEHKEHTVEIIRKQITQGGGEMQAVGADFAEKDLNDLIAYLQTL